MNVPADLGLRRATASDLPALVALEQRCFALDRQSPRSLAYLLTRAHAVTWLAAGRGATLAALTLLFRRGSGVARVYSIAVDAALRGQGVAATLLARAEAEAHAHGCDRMRCEVRADNRASLALFAAAGYVEFARTLDYYADGQTAIRMQKRIAGRRSRSG